MTSYNIFDQSSQTIQRLVYEYDRNYNRTKETEINVDANNIETTVKDRTSAFDGNNRLTKITDNLETQDNTIDYVYDDNGNTLSKTDNIQTTPEITSFIYDSRNQLTNTVRGPPDSGQTLGLYDYNYMGWRVRHLSSERGDIEYIYDGKSVLEERSLTSASLVAHYRYSDRLISLNTNNDEQFYHYSALRTTTNLTNLAGNTVVSYRTDVWGAVTNQEGNSTNRQIFTGQELDENTGLVYFGARYYDPDTGRFINEDTYLGESLTAPSLHRYLYAYANPGYWIDILGYANVVGYVYDIQIDTPDGRVRYIGQAKALKARLGSTGHKWVDVIRHKNTRIESTAVHADLNREATDRKTWASARRQALSVVEQQKINIAELEESSKGKLQNVATAAKAKNIPIYKERHNVSEGKDVRVIKAEGETYSRRKLFFSSLKPLVTKEGANGPRQQPKLTGKVSGVLDVGSVALSLRNEYSNRKYEKAPFVLHDDDGSFMMGAGFDGWTKPYYRKEYIDKINEDGSTYTEDIPKREYKALKEEMKDAYGDESIWTGWEPGLLQPDLEKVKPVDEKSVDIDGLNII